IPRALIERATGWGDMGAERPTWSEIAPRRERAPLDAVTLWMATVPPVAVQSGRLDHSLVTILVVLAGATLASALTRAGRLGHLVGLGGLAMLLAMVLEPWPATVLLAAFGTWTFAGGVVDGRG